MTKPKRKAMSTHDLVQRNPIKAAISRARIEQQMRKVKIEIYFQQPGQDATLCLAHLGWVLGLGAEVERAALGITQRLRIVHGALRHVHDMCMHGYKWSGINATVFDQAVTLANEAFMENPHLVAGLLPGVEEFGQAIREHKVRRDHVAGAEFYQAAAV